MKITWGAGIAGAFVLFAAAVAFMVLLASRERVDLVADDYYDQEIAYQGQIDIHTRTAALPGRATIAIDSGHVRITFPASLNPRNLRGELRFYRPSDRRLDFSVPLALDGSNQQRIPTDAIARGFWRIDVRWETNDLSYGWQQPLVIP